MGVICNVHIVNTGAAAYILKWAYGMAGEFEEGAMGGDKLTYFDSHISKLW